MARREPFKSIAEQCKKLDRPMLTPHLEHRPIGEGKVLLVSETFNTLLHGQIYVDLLELLNGQHDLPDISTALAPPYSQSTVDAAIAELARRGYIISGQFRMDHRQAAYWTSLGVTPLEVEQTLSSCSLEIHGDDDGRMTRCLESVGIAVGSGNPVLSVFVCTDYLDPRTHEFNLRHLKSGAVWLPVRPKGMQPMFGPVFQPDCRGPCLDCLAHRLKNNNEVHAFLRNRCGDKAAFRPQIAAPVILDSVYGMIAMEIAKWLVLGDSEPLHEHVITFNISTLTAANHLVMQRPQCASCGAPPVRSPTREPEPVVLKAGTKASLTSSGLRTLSPAQTLEQYRHLVSPVSGIVTWVKRTASPTDPWLHVHWAGSNMALRIKNLSSLRRSLRSKSAGKGTTSEQSEVGALCEAIERYCGAFHGEEIRARMRFADFLDKDDDRAIHPNDVQLFSQRQMNDAEKINALGHFYNVIPPHFDIYRELDWTPVWSLTQERQRFLPTALVYGMTPEQRADAGLWADSNGCAAGNTLEEAILQGFLELVERDAFAIWWYNRLPRPGVNLESFGVDYLTEAPAYYRRYNRDLWILDLTSDLNIPVFVALSRRTDSDTEDIIYGAGAHLNPQIAALRAICELNQCLTWVPRPDQSPRSYGIDDQMCLKWWQTGKLIDHPYLAPAKNFQTHPYADLNFSATDDLKCHIEWCRAQVEAKGLEFLVLNQTRPDVGMPVVRVIVPGLRHFWERFAPGRLYDVPVELKLRQTPLDELHLNPIPVIA